MSVCVCMCVYVYVSVYVCVYVCVCVCMCTCQYYNTIAFITLEVKLQLMCSFIAS